MLKPAGIIRRIATEPTIRLEYLTNNPAPNEQPTWSENEAAAFFFDDHYDAEIAAKILHARIGGHLLFAVTRPQRHPTPERELFFHGNGEATEVVNTRPRRKRRSAHAITGSHINDAEVSA